MKQKIIIVGAGSSGLLIAKNLSSIANVEVFEKAGNKSIPIFYRMPLMIGLWLGKKTNTFNIENINSKSERLIPFFRSNVIGGSSEINGCVHAMGDFKKWKTFLKKFKFCTTDLMEAYNKIFSFKNEKGKINLKTSSFDNLDSCFLSALKRISVEKGNIEWGNTPRANSIINNVGRLFRSSILDLVKIKNLAIHSQSDVEALLTNEKGNVIGIKSNGVSIYSNKVILCAGVIGTNRILLNTVTNGWKLPNKIKSLIGKEIGDHTNLRINVKANFPVNSLNEISNNILTKFSLLFNHLIGKKTLMRGTGATSCAHLDLDNDGVVDTRINLLRFFEIGRFGAAGNLFSSPKPGFSLSITHIHPTSRGEINQNKISPNYLYTKKDRSHLSNALKFVYDFLQQPIFSKFIKEIEKASEIKNESEYYIDNNFFSGYHLIGGTHKILNDDFSVKHTKNLFVCDASIFKEFLSSNIHSPVLVAAELFSRRFAVILSSEKS